MEPTKKNKKKTEINQFILNIIKLRQNKSHHNHHPPFNSKTIININVSTTNNEQQPLTEKKFNPENVSFVLLMNSY